MKTWINVPEHSDFSIHNLPFGIFSYSGGEKKVGVAIGEHVLDLHQLQLDGFLSDLGLSEGVFRSEFLNDFMSLGKACWSKTRTRIQNLLTDSDEIKDRASSYLISQEKVELHLPVKVSDYTDFYSSEEHATNVGIMFRGKDNALMPNWRHLPVGYHGRASSIIVSGQPFHRPKGQVLPAGADTPVFGPTKSLDIELETAFIVGQPTTLGQTLSTAEAEDYIFGMVLFNDWSARDIQKWEYQPLGPFLGKSFASSISPWVVTMEALEPFRTDGPKQHPEVLDYLNYQGKKSYDINLEVYIQPKGGAEERIAVSNHKFLYWNMVQQLAHQTVNGCNINVGDMYGSGTISGKEPNSFGSLLELTWRGEKPLMLKDGSERTFLQDHDTIILKGYGATGEVRVGFGEVRTQVLPAS